MKPMALRSAAALGRSAKGGRAFLVQCRLTGHSATGATENLSDHSCMLASASAPALVAGNLLTEMQ